MMRLLFLCLLLLLPAAAAVSEDTEASGDEDPDDEELDRSVISDVRGGHGPGSTADKTTGVDESSNQFTLIVIVVAATVLTLSVAAIVTIMLVRRQMHNRQQGIYSVPTEQDQKGAV